MTTLDAARLVIQPSRPYPIGVETGESGCHFSIVSRHATKVWFAVFDPADIAKPAAKPVAEFALDPATHRKGDIWSFQIEGLMPGTHYMYRFDGPNIPAKGLLYDPERYIFDPCTRHIAGDAAKGGRCVVTPNHAIWNGDGSPRTPFAKTLIYETHVKGMTMHHSANTSDAGTFLGFIEKIPHLKELGVTAVEFLPIHQSGESTILDRVDSRTGKPLTNYWGYQPIAYFAPDNRYSTPGGDPINEFRQLVVALHEADMEVIVDVVFNHTAEYGRKGPLLCFKGVDNPIYYHLDANGDFRDFTGCGNTFNCNHPIVRDFILDCLRYWTTQFHVDGFRFDLASVMNRDRAGNLHYNSALVDHIAEDPLLGNVKLISEPWDIAGGYQVGGFGGGRWCEWNGKYRDDVRRFWRGDAGVKGDFARRLTGSPDLYQGSGRTPQASINFVTAHDGFTLRDLVSNNHKHNEANGEESRDGTDDNMSWNCGAEGDSDDPIVLALRMRLQKDYLATLFLSLGVPMLLGGDEFGRTQKGNNNAYCQDNELTWFDWALLDRYEELFNFVKGVIQFRKENPVFERTVFFTGLPSSPGVEPDILWFDANARPLEWGAVERTLACRIDASVNGGVTLYIAFNPSPESVEFRAPKGLWRVRISTTPAAPFDIPGSAIASVYNGGRTFLLGQRSLMVLEDVTSTVKLEPRTPTRD